MGVAIQVLVVGVLQLSLYGALQTVYSVPVFCIFVALWTQALLESWRRKEKRQSFKWGMENFEEMEQDRYCAVLDVNQK